jgi:uncharacterized SAM-dependent methyltransferase
VRQFVLKGASCATPRGQAGPPIAISFPPARAGNLPEFALLKTPDEVDPAFRSDVLAGLAEPIPSIPARWLYDLRGSELFDDITRLPAYYPTRTETALLKERMPEIAGLACDNCAIVEFGSGSSTKTPLLLEAMKPAAYVPIDISGDYLREERRAGRCAIPTYSGSSC